MEEYLRIVDEILTRGKLKHNRTGVDTIAIEGSTFKHDMADGFPILTTKKIKFENVSSELEFFVRGVTDKKWLQDRNNPLWTDWCNPEKVPYGTDEEIKKRMREERDLGPIYGWQWNHFGAKYTSYDADYTNQGINQIANLVEKLKTNPNDRRMYVTAWNPTQLNQMALPPCHYGFYVNVLNGRLNLTWDQRSVDTAIGLPFNIASYATLLHLLANESGFKEGLLTGSLKDTHIYVNHIDGLKEQLKRKPSKLPEILTKNFTSVFGWQYTDSELVDYNPDKFIKFDIAV